MSDNDLPHDHISKKQVLYTMSGTDAVVVQRVPYQSTDAETLMLDVYVPADRRNGQTLPVVILVTGYADAGARKMLGCSFSEMGSFISWARLIAASGIVAVTYTNQDPRDVHAAIEYVRAHADALGVDGNRLGIWSCSGHGPNALSLLMSDSHAAVRCAVLCYPCTMDLDGATRMADASTEWGFLNACAGRSVGELSRDIPVFIARAGEDQMPGLNTALDRFVAEALACNLPITLVNHAQAPHAFDLFHDSPDTRQIIRNSLGFMQVHLGAARTDTDWPGKHESTQSDSVGGP